MNKWWMGVLASILSVSLTTGTYFVGDMWINTVVGEAIDKHNEAPHVQAVELYNKNHKLILEEKITIKENQAIFKTEIEHIKRNQQVILEEIRSLK